jgi:type IV secretion system protein VirB10
LQIRGAPATSARLSRKAALAAVAILAGILCVVVMNVSKPKPTLDAAEDKPKNELRPALGAASTLTRNVPEVIPAPGPIEPLPQPPLATASAPELQSQPDPKKKNPVDEARLADSAIPGFGAPPVGGVLAGVPAVAANLLQQASGGVDDAARRAAAGEPDLNQQDQKLAFLEKPRRSAYLANRLTPPISPFEIKTGTVIPSILITAINSDLPGEILAQVSQNVYDTATGTRLLIPQGTKLFGSYDSKVAFAQGRLLVAWQRLIFPDASTLELDGMSGTDQAGQSGFADRVNNHYGRIFTAALLTSVLSAAYQISQPDQQTQGNVLVTPPSDRQIAAGAVGQQVTELGIEIARRNLRIQPTIEIRKGYRLNVMVNKDVVFPSAYVN